MILENKRARLIPFNTRGAQELASIIYEPEIWEYMGHQINTSTDLNTYIKNTLKSAQNQECLPFLVVDKDYGALAGCTRIGKLELNSKRAEIGWTWYGTKFHGTGLNQAVKSLLLDFAFEHLQLNRIQLGADVRNLKSQRAIEKLGAVKEGIRRHHYIDSQGHIQDDVYYSITKLDWIDSIKSNLTEL